MLGERRGDLSISGDLALLCSLDLLDRLEFDRVRIGQVDAELLFDARRHSGALWSWGLRVLVPRARPRKRATCSLHSAQIMTPRSRPSYVRLCGGRRVAVRRA